MVYNDDDQYGRKEYVGQWVKGKNSWEVSLNFQKGLKNGFGKETKKNGEIYEGNWTNNAKDGEGTHLYENGCKLLTFTEISC